MLAILPIVWMAGDVAKQEAPVVFQRSESEITRITVRDADAQYAVPRRLFSNFLEHLGGSIYQALWANVVYNPQFEAERDGRLAQWTLEGAEWVEDGVAGRCVRLQSGARVRQEVALPVHRQLRYRGTVWVRSVRGRAPALILRVQDMAGRVICSATVRAGGTRWQPRRFEMHVPEGALRRGQTAHLTLEVAAGILDADMLELFPADAVDGMDPEVVAIARDLRIELLRWPGGNFASGYHWRNGVAPREKRPTVPNPAWPGLETHHFGTDEFMSFCRRIGAKPHICINAGNGSPEEAAAWVEYCNGGPETQMGALRAANGHPAPYNVRVWEIGNELYGEWQIGHTDAAGNAKRYVEFRRAMLAVDPSIEIIATGRGDLYVGDGLEQQKAWNTALLKAAQAAEGLPQYLSIHPLVPLPSGLGQRHSYEEIYLSAVAHPLWWTERFLPEAKKLLAQYGGLATPRLAVTEWGIIVGGRDWREYPNHDTQSGAVYAGLFYHALMRSGGVAEIANVTALMHGGSIRKHRGVVYVTPMIHVQRMYGNAKPARLVPIAVSGPAYDVPRRGFLPEVRDVPWVDAVMAQARGQWYLYLVNRDPAGSRDVEAVLPRNVREAEAEGLWGDPRAGNDVDRPDLIAVQRIAVEVQGETLRMRLPAACVAVVRIRWRR